MNFWQRLLWTTIAAVGAVLSVVLLTRFGSQSQGPLAAVLSRAGTTVSGFEQRVVRQVRGSERAERLAWFHPYRHDPERLRHPDRVLLGAYDGAAPHSLQGVVELEKAINAPLPLIQIYTAWGDRPDQQFPLRPANAVWNLGSVPVITWEPWLTDFQSQLHPHLPLREQRDKNGLAAIARGEYDFYIDRWAAEAAEFGHPLFVRFGHEMNDPYRYPWGPQNNKPDAYVAAWRHVVERFRAAGATNVLWVWSPHLAYEGFEWFYPGDDVVDWVATGALNYGTVARWSDWWSFHEIFGNRYEQIAQYGKPIMVAEFGTLAAGGDRAAWFREALADLRERYPLVRALLFFHVPADATVTYQMLDWSFAADSALARTVGEAVRPLGIPQR